MGQSRYVMTDPSYQTKLYYLPTKGYNDKICHVPVSNSNALSSIPGVDRHTATGVAIGCWMAAYDLA